MGTLDYTQLFQNACSCSSKFYCNHYLSSFVTLIRCFIGRSKPLGRLEEFGQAVFHKEVKIQRSPGTPSSLYHTDVWAQYCITSTLFLVKRKTLLCSNFHCANTLNVPCRAVDGTPQLLLIDLCPSSNQWLGISG